MNTTAGTLGVHDAGGALDFGAIVFGTLTFDFGTRAFGTLAFGALSFGALSFGVLTEAAGGVSPLPRAASSGASFATRGKSMCGPR